MEEGRERSGCLLLPPVKLRVFLSFSRDQRERWAERGKEAGQGMGTPGEEDRKAHQHHTVSSIEHFHMPGLC